MTDQVNEAVAWPERMVNIPCPDGSGDRIVGFRIPEDSPLLGRFGLSEPLAWFRSVTIDRHPSRGVVDEAMVERGAKAAWEMVPRGVPWRDASDTIQDDWVRIARVILQAAQPAVPSDEWKDRLATALDDLGNPTGLIYFANGRVIGSRQFYIHVVHGEALPVRFADPAHQPAAPSVPEGRYRLAISKGEVQALIDYHDWCQSEADSMGAETTGDVQRIAELKALLAATPKDQPAQEVG